MQIRNGFLHCLDRAAQISPLQAGGDGHVALQVFAADLGLPRQFGDGCQRTQRSGVSGRAVEQRVAHGVQRTAVALGIANANGVGNVVRDDRRSGRFAFENRGRINGDFFCREAGTRRDRRIHLEDCGRIADRIVDAVQDVNNAGNLADGIGDPRRPLGQSSGHPAKTT